MGTGISVSLLGGVIRVREIAERCRSVCGCALVNATPIGDY
jgi:hypothetical protein